MPPPTLAPAKYWREVQLLLTEIEGAIIIHHTYEEINRLAVHDQVVRKKLHQDPQFWQTQMHCLQTSLFLTLSRIFDNKANTHTIHTLINATLGNLHLFSAAALAARKTSGGLEGRWLDEYMAKSMDTRGGQRPSASENRPDALHQTLRDSLQTNSTRDLCS